MVRHTAILWLTPLLLTGCDQLESTAGPGGGNKGRYAGIGVYAPGALWRAQTDARKPANAAEARLSDDDAIIVTIDSKTGEVRQCGNLSGHCVSLPVWASETPKVPASLSKHADDLEREPAVQAKTQ